jgi:hypothetical protein
MLYLLTPSTVPILISNETAAQCIVRKTIFQPKYGLKLNLLKISTFGSRVFAVPCLIYLADQQTSWCDADKNLSSVLGASVTTHFPNVSMTR